MIWLLLACSNEKMMATESMPQDDSGFVYELDTGQGETATDDADAVLPVWKKWSINLDNVDGVWQSVIWEDDYTDEMEWVCQTKYQYDKVESIPAPVAVIEEWFRLSQPTVLESSCGQVLEPVDSIEVGVGEVLEDIAVASEVTHWLQEDVSLETEQVWGAYYLESAERLWAFGVGYKPTENTYILRTVYSLPY